MSWCKLEVRLAGPKAVTALPPGGAPPPPLAVAALNLKTWLNPATGASEVVAASVVHLPAMRVDAPFPKVQTVSLQGWFLSVQEASVVHLPTMRLNAPFPKVRTVLRT